MEDPQKNVVFSSLQKQHQEKSSHMQQLTATIDKLSGNIQEYTRQKMENNMVLKELRLLTDDSAVFKQIGPCLIKQDMFEAKTNVEKRIEYISEELNRLQRQRNTCLKERREVMDSLGDIQAKVQRIVQDVHAASIKD
jgi:prefoldin beta subunit